MHGTFQPAGLLAGELVDDMIEGPLPAQHAVDQFGQKPPIRPLQGAVGQFTVEEDIGVGAFFFDAEEDVEGGTARCCGQGGSSVGKVGRKSAEWKGDRLTSAPPRFGVSG